MDKDGIKVGHGLLWGVAHAKHLPDRVWTMDTLLFAVKDAFRPRGRKREQQSVKQR